MATTYANGEIPAESLTRTSTGHLLRADAAAAFEALADAFEREFGKPLNVTDAYRPKWGTGGQVAIFEDRYPHLTKQGVNDQRGPWKGKYWWRRNNTAAAAVPGTSNHGWGLALDLGSNVNNLGTREQLWLVENGPRFGWVWPTWARKIPTLEPWHYEFVGTVNFPIGGTGSITTPTIPGRPAPLTPTESELDMPYIVRCRVAGHKDNGTWWLVLPRTGQKPLATPLGRNDQTEGLAAINYVTTAAYTTWKSTVATS